MQETSRIQSIYARSHWREVLDGVCAGADVVISRHGADVAALIPYEDYVALKDQLEDLRADRRAGAIYEEWKRDPSIAVPYKM